MQDAAQMDIHIATIIHALMRPGLVEGAANLDSQALSWHNKTREEGRCRDHTNMDRKDFLIT